MEKVSIGIDIAKDWCDLAVLAIETNTVLLEARFAQRAADHQRLIASLARFDVVHLVLEATGVYHLQLTQALVEAALPVSVINPLQLRRFAQMKLRRTKTDQVDARLLAHYGREQKPPLHVMASQTQQHLARLQRHIALLVKMRTMLLNASHAQSHDLCQPAICQQVMSAELAQLQHDIARLEAEQARLLAVAFAPVRDLLLSIPGIGPRTVMALLAYLGDFSGFRHAGALSAFMGLNPVLWESGQWRGQVHISKQGHAGLRCLLYLCALSAVRSNAPCRRLYERLRAKGKPAKVAYIAVANKLLRQVIAVVRSGVPFDNEYEEKRALAA